METIGLKQTASHFYNPFHCRTSMKSWTNYKVKWNEIQRSYSNYAIFICYNDEKTCMYTICLVSRLSLGLLRRWWLRECRDDNIFNFFPNIGQHFSIDCQYRVLNSCFQCVYIRDMRTVNNSLYVSLKENLPSMWYQMNGEAKLSNPIFWHCQYEC